LQEKKKIICILYTAQVSNNTLPVLLGAVCSMKKKIKHQRYIVKKYIMASSIYEALDKEKKTIPSDCWIDEDWKKDQKTQLESAIGFGYETNYEED